MNKKTKVKKQNIRCHLTSLLLFPYCQLSILLCIKITCLIHHNVGAGKAQTFQNLIRTTRREEATMEDDGDGWMKAVILSSPYRHPCKSNPFPLGTNLTHSS